MADFRTTGPHGPIVGSVHGSGPVVVLVAGLGSTRQVWGGLPRLLGRRMEVVTFDNRGVGGSRKGERFTVARAADDTIAVLDHLGCDRAAVLGASMGALIALAAALHHPNRVTRLALVSGAVHLSEHARRAVTLIADLLRHLPPSRVGPAMMTLGFAPPFHEQFPALVDEVAGLYGIDPDDVPGALDQAAELLRGRDLRPELARIRIPTLVLAGGRDPLVAAEDTAAIADAIPGAELIHVPHAAHSVLAEGGGPLLAQVVAFLAGDGQQRPPRPTMQG